MATSNRISTLSGALSLLSALALICLSTPARADVVYVHASKGTEFMIGEFETEQVTAYGPQRLLYNQRHRLVGGLVTQFFGKAKESRETHHLYLDQGEIHQIEWEHAKVFIIPLDRFGDMKWFEDARQRQKEMMEVIGERYEVRPARLEIAPVERSETVQGYLCRKFVCDLRLDTYDKRKNANSVTLIRQEIWVSEAVPGYAAYLDIHRKLGAALGLDAERFGPLSTLLRFWPGTLEPVKDQIGQIKGYPVKRTYQARAQYIAAAGTPDSKTSEKIVKTETDELVSIQTMEPDPAVFQPPVDFRRERLQ